jgi:hypothetical protein
MEVVLSELNYIEILVLGKKAEIGRQRSKGQEKIREMVFLIKQKSA